MRRLIYLGLVLMMLFAAIGCAATYAEQNKGDRNPRGASSFAAAVGNDPFVGGSTSEGKWLTDNMMYGH